MQVSNPVLTAFDEKKRRGVFLADHSAIDAHTHYACFRVSSDNSGKGMDVIARLPGTAT
jgi:hypothetical protein